MIQVNYPYLSPHYSLSFVFLIFHLPIAIPPITCSVLPNPPFHRHRHYPLIHLLRDPPLQTCTMAALEKEEHYSSRYHEAKHDGVKNQPHSRRVGALLGSE